MTLPGPLAAGGRSRSFPLIVAVAGALAILGFYLGRISMPLPIFATDEANYLIRALFSPETIARNPLVADVTNGTVFSVIRGAASLGGDTIIVDRIANSAAYLAGMLLMVGASTARLSRASRIGFAALAIAFPYYRFVFSNMAEGLFVGILAVFCVATILLYRRRPILHSALAGGLLALLVLAKPHRVAAVAAFALVALLDLILSRQFAVIALRVVVSATVFFAVGNLVQWGAGDAIRSPLLFFESNFYQGTLAAGYPPGALSLGLVELLGMTSVVLLLAGPPMVIALGGQFDRWRRRPDRGRFFLTGQEVTFLILLFALGATLAMVTIYAMKVAADPSETRRLWGRYFEFFIPLIWLAAAPAIAAFDAAAARGRAFLCAGLMTTGLIGLLWSFRAGIALFPWDASVTSAFFAPDPAGAGPFFPFPFRTASVIVSVASIMALALRRKVLAPGVGIVVALGLISTGLDHVWLQPLIAARTKLDQELNAVSASLPAQPGATRIASGDVNESLLGFLKLGGRPLVLTSPPDQLTANDLGGAQALIIAGSDKSPGPEWARSFAGERIMVYRRVGTSPAPL